MCLGCIVRHDCPFVLRQYKASKAKNGGDVGRAAIVLCCVQLVHFVSVCEITFPGHCGTPRLDLYGGTMKKHHPYERPPLEIQNFKSCTFKN